MKGGKKRRRLSIFPRLTTGVEGREELYIVQSLVRHGRVISLPDTLKKNKSMKKLLDK